MRQSQQKGGCERNHVELRKLLPKGWGISFDRLTGRDCAVLMSQLNSEPRPSLGGMCAIDMPLAALGADGRELLDALGVEKVPYGELDMTVGALQPVRMSPKTDPGGPAEPCPKLSRTLRSTEIGAISTWEDAGRAFARPSC